MDFKTIGYPLFIRTKTSIFMYGFQNNLAQLYSVMSEGDIWKFHVGRSNVDKLSLHSLRVSIIRSKMREFQITKLVYTI